MFKRLEQGIPWTFKTWILKFKGVDLPIGDLANDVSEDSNFPDDDDLSEIYDYLISKHATEPVLDTFVTSWNFYLASNVDPLELRLQHDTFVDTALE